LSIDDDDDEIPPPLPPKQRYLFNHSFSLPSSATISPTTKRIKIKLNNSLRTLSID
jgi:hypothetical protein